MEKYLGVKIVDGEPMNLGDYNKFRGWTIPANEDPNTEGYKVVYQDGYVSWCPKRQFEEANRRIDQLTFGMALEALNKGCCVARLGWNGKNMHVSKITLFTADNLQIANPCLVLYNVSRQYNTWVPSITDIFAEDWQIVE